MDRPYYIYLFLEKERAILSTLVPDKTFFFHQCLIPESIVSGEDGEGWGEGGGKGRGGGKKGGGVGGGGEY